MSYNKLSENYGGMEMKTIKAYTSYNEETNTRYYRTFDIKELVPEVGDDDFGDKVVKVEPVKLDISQDRHEVYNYEYFAVTTASESLDDEEEDEECVSFIAVHKSNLYAEGEWTEVF